MDRNIIAVALVGALLIAVPGATALATPTTGLTPFTPTPTTPTTPTTQHLTSAPTIIADAPDTNLPQAINQLQCRHAVAIPIHWWGGHIINVQQNDASLLLRDAIVTGYTIVEIPRYELITTTIWEPREALQTLGQLPLVGSIFAKLEPTLEPITKTTEKLVVDQVKQPILATIDYAVDVSWQQTQVQWTPHHETIYLNLAAGLPHIASGIGDHATICDSTTPIHGALPTTHSGYDLYAATPQPANAWYADILSLDVQLAQTHHYDEPRSQSWGLDAPPSKVISAVLHEQDRLKPTADQLRQQDDIPNASDPEPATKPANTSNQAAPQNSKKGTTNLMAAGLATAMGTMGLLIARRRG